CTPDGPGKEYSHLPMADFGFIFDDIYRNLEALAGDPNGLGVVKKCISHAPWYGDGSYVEKYKSKMLNKLQYFVENPYANYAVQHALEIWGPEVCSDIITKISESIISMAIHKFASNVVETALKVSPDDMRVMLIHRLIDYGNTSCQNAAMITLMNSAYGVFVMSTALRLAPTTELCEQIYGALVRNYQRLPDSRNKQKWDK
ncbi:pumilio domain member 4, partial [Perkinsus olseni]